MLKGSCLCGTIQYQLDGPLGPIVMCHCSRCRKASGSAFATNAPVDSAHFRITSGSESLAEYASSPGVVRSFCRKCGSPLISRRDSMPDVLRLRVGTLDTPIDAKPGVHIFTASKAEWDDIHDDLPQHAARP